MPAATPVPPAPRLRLDGIRKRFGATIALDGVSFELGAGEVHALVGENGAGKSTLMKVLAGIHAPDAGRMALDGQAYRPRHPADARHAGVVMVHQELAIARHLTVAENIVLGAEPVRAGLICRGKMRQVAGEALAQLGRADIALSAKAGSLSVAEQQLVEIARAVALGCRVLVLDEPTSSLTQADTERLFALIRRLRAGGPAIIYISHFLEEVKAISDRFTVLRDGITAGWGATAETSVSAIARLMVGRSVSELYVRSPRQAGPVALTVDRLAGSGRISSVSLTLHRGEVLGIAGLVGAGRTELLRAIFGLEAVRAGEIRLGACTGRATPSRRWRDGMGFVSEDRKEEGLALALSIADNVTLTRLPFFVRPSAQAASARRWVDRLDVRCAGPRQPVADLSGGNQQKIAMARLLYHDVEVLLLDEPTRGIDVGAKEIIYRCIDGLAQAGKAVLVVSSYLPELFGICDRIAVMCRGVLGDVRPVAAWTEHEVMLAAAAAEEEG
jgi:ribose transport system ATP-binding protein